MVKTTPDYNLIQRVNNCLEILRAKKIKRSREYTELKTMLVPFGYKPFEIFAAYNFVCGETKNNWEASLKLAAYVANKKRRR